MANTNDRRSPVNVMRLTMWQQTSDTSKKTEYGTTAKEFTNSLNSVRYTPKTQTAEQYGDGIKVEDVVAKDGGELQVVIRAFANGDGAFLFGESETTDGVSVSSQNDIVPYLCVAYVTKRADGKYNLYKFPKVKFMPISLGWAASMPPFWGNGANIVFAPQGEDNRQQEGSQINFGTAELRGNYAPLLSSGADKYCKYGVDPEDDKDFIEKWFGTADYHTADVAGG